MQQAAALIQLAGVVMLVAGGAMLLYTTTAGRVCVGGFANPWRRRAAGLISVGLLSTLVGSAASLAL